VYTREVSMVLFVIFLLVMTIIIMNLLVRNYNTRVDLLGFIKQLFIKRFCSIIFPMAFIIAQTCNIIIFGKLNCHHESTIRLPMF